jgi:hypothetical protein
MTAPFLLDEMSEESACLEGRSTYVALYPILLGCSKALVYCFEQCFLTILRQIASITFLDEFDGVVNRVCS